MTNYYRIWLGQQSAFADECKSGSFIGVDYGIYQDLTNELPDRWQEFNEKFRPIWLDLHPGKSKISAGLSCGAYILYARALSKKISSCLLMGAVRIWSERLSGDLGDKKPRARSQYLDQ